MTQIKEATKRFINNLKDNNELYERDLLTFKRMKSVIELSDMINIDGLDYERMDIKKLISYIKRIYEYIGLKKELRYENLDYEIIIFQRNIGHIMSYGSNMEFVNKVLNKNINILTGIMFGYIVKHYGDIDIELIKYKNILGLFKHNDNTDELVRIMKGFVRADTQGEKGLMNKGDNVNDWIDIKIKVGNTVIDDKSKFVSATNKTLEKMFEQLTRDNESKYIQQKMVYKSAREYLESDEYKEYNAILTRHILIWILKSIIFDTDLKNYDFYWKHQEKLDRLFAEYKNKKGITAGAFTK